MRGKGSSTPKVSKQLTYSQTDLITNDIPKCLDKIISITGKNNSTLARQGDTHLDAEVAVEACPLGLAQLDFKTA